MFFLILEISGRFGFARLIFRVGSFGFLTGFLSKGNNDQRARGMTFLKGLLRAYVLLLITLPRLEVIIKKPFRNRRIGSKKLGLDRLEGFGLFVSLPSCHMFWLISHDQQSQNVAGN